MVTHDFGLGKGGYGWQELGVCDEAYRWYKYRLHSRGKGELLPVGASRDTILEETDLRQTLNEGQAGPARRDEARERIGAGGKSQGDAAE